MSADQQRQMQELQLQMARLQTEIEETKQREKTEKTFKEKASHEQNPNLDFMKEYLEKSAILKEYYESEDQPNHWYRKQDIMQHPAIKEFIATSGINLDCTPAQVLHSNLEYRKLVEDIEKQLSEMKEFYQPKLRCLPVQPFKEIEPDTERNPEAYREWIRRKKTHLRQEGMRCSQHPPPIHTKQAPSKLHIPNHEFPQVIFPRDVTNNNLYPGASQLKFVESVYNMFKIQQQKIEELENIIYHNNI